MTSLAYADAYFSKRIHGEPWCNMTNVTDKLKCLQEAEDIVNTLDFIGTPAGSDAFPRNGQTAVPTAVQDAICLIANALADGADPNRAMMESDLTLDRQGSHTQEYADGTLDHIVYGIPHAIAYRLLSTYLVDPNEIDIL